MMPCAVYRLSAATHRRESQDHAAMPFSEFYVAQREMPQNILLIQDDALDAKIVQDALSKSGESHFHVEWVRTCTAGLNRLAELGKQKLQGPGGIAAVLVDLRLPDVAGIETFDRLFASIPQIPIVILSSSRDAATAEAAIQRGAQDFLLKERLNDYVLPKTLAAAIDRAAIAEALFDEKERARVTLNSIGDAVVCTDIADRVSYLNIVAERLTGWPQQEAIGRSLEEVFRIIDSDTRAVVPNPMAIAARQNTVVGLPPNCILIRRDGVESAIEDSSAPIHDRRGKVTGAVMVFHDVSASRALTLKLAYYGQHDSLTDLPNRSLLHDRLSHAITCAHRHQSALAVLYLDIDRFKHINDSLGHPMGDRLLQSVALRLSACVRASDTVSRLGGDEFVILLVEMSHAQDAATCAEKLLQAIRMPYVLDSQEIHVTASIGIGVYPGDGSEVEALLQNADSAMYEAKNRGRNNYQFYRLDLNSSVNERQIIESGLRHAIERNELEVYYQPIVSVASGTIAAVEALVRWNHPAFGFILPARFISIAEESGLIVPIGQWVLRQACRQVNTWHLENSPKIRLAVNISAVELRSKEFVPGVAAILDGVGFDPKYLELELTETFLMQDSNATAVVLDALKELGVTIALDDFGTGYSSLSYMRRFPIDALKVDRSFVGNIATNADDASVVGAVINMGRSLNMRVVAEGVETREQFRFLEEHRCTEAQGFHFSSPLKAETFAGFLRQPTNSVELHPS
jgi:diguanylate cyclase (GGDEF)-like protein/PAS domain S-box-containing protein